MMRSWLACAALALPLVCAAQAPAQDFRQPVTLRGTLGEAQIQMNLRPKQEFEGGVEGNYFYFGQSRNILLAGETEEQDVFMEESENGTDVSGDWTGKLSGGLFSGEWQNADGSVKKPFSLRIVPVVPLVPAVPTQKQ